MSQDYFLTGHFNKLSEKEIYYKSNNTLIRPATGAENSIYDSLIFHPTVNKEKSWIVRKLLYEHLIIQENEKFKIIVDPYVDFRMNYDSYRNDISYLNKRGFALYGNLISRIYINTGFEENQGKFAQYIHDFYDTFGVIPGFGRIKQNSNGVFDFSNSYGTIAFKASKNFNFTLGYDKLFIGDGYRSMLLSDFSAPYMFFKSTVNVGRFEYNNIISKAINPNYNYILGNGIDFNINSEYPSKIISYNCLTYNIKDRWQITLFDALLVPEKTGFWPVLGYAVSPYIRDFFVGLSSINPNILVGLNLTYQNKKLGVFYGQFVVDDFKWSGFEMKKAAQLGYKNFDFFNIKNLYFQLEYNTADLGMYMNSNLSPQLHYGHQNQTLAHPAGSGFDEVLAITGYSLGRFEVIFKFNYLRYKEKPDPYFNLQDIFNWNKYHSNPWNIGNIEFSGKGNEIINMDAQLIYNLNKANRIQIFAGVTYRTDKFADSKTYFMNFGLRTALRYNYYDF